MKCIHASVIPVSQDNFENEICTIKQIASTNDCTTTLINILEKQKNKID